jgi:hypothetical protein
MPSLELHVTALLLPNISMVILALLVSVER